MKNIKQKIDKKKFFPLGFIIFVWFIFSAPYFVNQLTPYPAAYLVRAFSPWNAYPEYAGPVKNIIISDVINQIYPWKHFTIEQLKQGQLPLWNPYSFAGNPHLANYQTAVFSPFTFLFFLLPFIDAWSILILLQPLVAGLGLYLFLRTIHISSIGGLIGSISFMFCGFIVAWMPWGTLAMAIAWLPWVLLGIEKLFQQEKRRVLWSLLIAFSLVTSFFSGHFQTSSYFFLYTFSYFIYKSISTKNKKAALWSFGSILLGMCVSLLQIIPSLQFYAQTFRSEIVNNLDAIPYYYLVTIFAPDFFGNPVTRNDWMNFYAEWAGFIGIIPLTLAVSALFHWKKKSESHFFFVAGMIALLLAIHTPLQNIFSQFHIPIFSTSIPSRIIVLFSFSFAVLAGFGYDLLLTQEKKQTLKKKLLPFLLVGGFLLALWAALGFGKILPPEKTLLAEKNLILPSFIFFFATGFVILSLVNKRKILVISMSFILLLLTLINSLYFAQKWISFEEKRFVYPSNPVIAAMQKNIGQGRVFGDFYAHIDTKYQLSTIEGYDPLFSKRYGEFIQSANTGKFTKPRMSNVRLERRGIYAERVLDLLGVTLIYHPRSFSNEPWAFPVWINYHKYKMIYQDKQFKLYKNLTALPRAKMFYQYEVIKGDTQLIERFYSPQFDFRNTLLLEENPRVKINKEKVKNKVQIVSYTPNKLTIAVETEKPGLLFLSDNYYPQWGATVNGKETKIYRADYSLRSVIVPAGKSTVEFIYRGLF